MTVRDDIQQALHDAIGWQETLAEAHAHCDDGVYEEAQAQIKRYRAILRRRYGTDRHPSNKEFDGARLVSIEEMRRTLKTER